MRRVVLAAAGLALLLGGPAAVPRAGAARCAAGVEERLGNEKLAYAGYARGTVVAYRGPGRTPFATFGTRNANGYPTVFGVVGAVAGRACAAAWYRVELPIRPNETVGYVRATDVAVRTVNGRLEIDLSLRRLTFFRSGRAVFRTSVAIGTSATPTPIGRYYVNQRLRPGSPSGPFGPAAIGISAFSNVLTGWTQGGPIGIHGTNEPWLIGQRISHGCIRLRNAAITWLFPRVSAGTPVVIHP